MTQEARKKILVTERDDGVRSLFQRVLSNRGYEVETADRGESGLQHYRQFSPDLITTSMRLNSDGAGGIEQGVMAASSTPCVCEKKVTKDL